MPPDSSRPPARLSADGRPYLPENRRVKAWGMTIMALSLPAWLWLANHPLVDRWFSGTARDLALAGLVFAVALNLVAAGALVLASGLGVVRPLRDARGRWAAALAMLAANCSIPVIAFSMVQEDATVTGLGDGWVALVVAVMIALYVTIIGLFRRSWQWEAFSADDVRRRDPRAPVVYLRAFADDGQLVVPARTRFQRVYGRALSTMTLTSAEQELAFILQHVGPVIAIGKPGETLPELGAARLYVPHASWQQTVIEMLEQSSLALVRVGASPGVLWELDQVMAQSQRSKVLLLVLGPPETVAAGVGAIESRLGQPLDVIPPPAFRLQPLLAFLSGDPHQVIGVLVGFDRDGRPRAHAIPAMSYRPGDLARTVMMRPFSGPLRAAARRLFEWQGRPWHDPPSRLAAVTLAFLAGGFGAHWFYLGWRRKGIRRLLLLPVIYLTLPYAWFEACRWLLADLRQFEESVAADGRTPPGGIR